MSVDRHRSPGQSPRGAVGELVENHFRVGCAHGAGDQGKDEPAGHRDFDAQELHNSNRFQTALKEFFGSSQLSQFMDQTIAIRDYPQGGGFPALGPVV